MPNEASTVLGMAGPQGKRTDMGQGCQPAREGEQKQK